MPGLYDAVSKKDSKGQGLLKISSVSSSARNIYVIVALFCGMKENGAGEGNDCFCLVLAGSLHPDTTLKKTCGNFQIL